MARALAKGPIYAGTESIQAVHRYEGLHRSRKAAAVDAVSACARQIILTKGKRHRHFLVGNLACGDYILQV